MENESELKQVFDLHARDDKNFQDEQRIFNIEQSEFKAETEGSLGELHKKVDTIAQQNVEIMQFMKNMNVGIAFFRFSWNNAAKIGSLLLLVMGIFVFFKMGIAGVLAFFVGGKS